jgi:hypothetical protein
LTVARSVRLLATVASTVMTTSLVTVLIVTVLIVTRRS